MSNHVHKDYAGAKLGMWLFLFTEVLLFGGMFVLYSAYFHEYPREFHIGGKQLDVVIGTLNTVVLLLSSFSIAAAITYIQQGKKKLALIYTYLTIGAAFIFLVNKTIEWRAKFHHGIWPDSPHLRELSHGENIFFGLYFLMTGLHALHVIIGMVVLSVMVYFLKKDVINQQDFVKLENAGLYWHIVDLIWIFLFPLFYLVL
ncbi:cytochrome c oxidase subunit 3 family protein [Seleniivibrio woodruffii]|uniref:Cytochrome c oxidase subunit 3 n=1 Tax=Seleniivibrio woodruffii TaxID=1078050 RepID=A0A4V2PRW4_9BACT|nr:cytochrome c oxidase subunit 3 family protein [Seleniivibrio woodruffii]TCK60401.1 cytochrome c oxidase subunit 3 [Seleniivibrio woodruffii]TVZ36029.1 cytochrome c oxidase subunit 3 [Seleniivibrio woodruffii]